MRAAQLMRPLTMLVLLAACDGDPPTPMDDLAMSDLQLPITIKDLPVPCSPECSTTEYCLLGSQAHLLFDGGVKTGCNPLPAVCQHDCGCLLSYFAPDTCSCSLDQNGVEVVWCFA